MKKVPKLSLTILVAIVLIGAIALGFFWKDIPFSQDLTFKGKVVAVYHPSEGGIHDSSFVVESNQTDRVAPVHLNFTLDSSLQITDKDGKRLSKGAIKEGEAVSVRCTVNSSDPSDPTKLPALIEPTSVSIQ